MIKALTKFGFSAGAITGTICAGESALFETGDLQPKISRPTKTLNSISKFEDIDVFARERGCDFVFVKLWNKKEVYTADEFVNLEKDSNEEQVNWKEKAWQGAENNKGSCQQGRVVALSYRKGGGKDKFGIQFN